MSTVLSISKCQGTKSKDKSLKLCLFISKEIYFFISLILTMDNKITTDELIMAFTFYL